MAEAGSTQAVSLDDALVLWYSELRAVARRVLRTERQNHTLQATELVNELVKDLVQQGRVDFNDRSHVFAYFTLGIRNLLCSYGRRRHAHKRGGDWVRVPWTSLDGISSEDDLARAAEVHTAVEKLRRVYPQSASVVEMRFFLGLRDPEIGAALGYSERWVRKEWAFARAWLLEELGTGDDVGALATGCTASAAPATIATA